MDSECDQEKRRAEAVGEGQERQKDPDEDAQSIGKEGRRYGSARKISEDIAQAEEKVMPFRSVKQRKFMWARHPKIARRWTKKYGSKIVRGKSRSKRRK